MKITDQGRDYLLKLINSPENEEKASILYIHFNKDDEMDLDIVTKEQIEFNEEGIIEENNSIQIFYHDNYSKESSEGLLLDYSDKEETLVIKLEHPCCHHHHDGEHECCHHEEGEECECHHHHDEDHECCHHSDEEHHCCHSDKED